MNYTLSLLDGAPAYPEALVWTIAALCFAAGVTTALILRRIL